MDRWIDRWMSQEAKKPRSQKPRSQEAKSQEAKKPRSHEAKKPRSHKAKKPRSHEAKKPPGATRRLQEPPRPKTKIHLKKKNSPKKTLQLQATNCEQPRGGRCLSFAFLCYNMQQNRLKASHKLLSIYTRSEPLPCLSSFCILVHVPGSGAFQGQLVLLHQDTHLGI